MTLEILVVGSSPVTHGFRNVADVSRVRGKVSTYLPTLGKYTYYLHETAPGAVLYHVHILRWSFVQSGVPPT